MTRREFVGEFVGTFILVLFGTGSVAVSVLFDAHQGLFQIGIIWGIGVTLAIYMSRHLSCAHFNPAVTIAMVTSGRMTVKKAPVYLAAQFLGAFTAGMAIYLLFSPSIAAFEAANQITRGSFESVQSAKMFGEYYAQPGSTAVLSMAQAMGAEMIGTFFLVLIIFFLTESCNVGKPDNVLTPVFIGITVTSMLCLIAPLTQAGLNPARDFSPRIVAWIFGWGEWAFPDQQGGAFWVYIVGPILGGLIAGQLFTRFIEPLMTDKKTAVQECCRKGKCNVKSTLVIIGGFLGAGKTSLLWEMAKLLKEKGEKVGLITNDQASELVDTAFLETNGDMVREVSGSCFCCNFNGFADAITYINNKNEGGVIFAEPVGSCTDLSATIMQPLKEKYSAEINLTPLTVLADPFKLKEILADATSAASYISLKQFEEADILLINKIDLISAEELTVLKNAASEKWPNVKVMAVSAKTGEGLMDWFDTLMHTDAVGTNITEVDYDIYAEGEAAFGWLNASFSIGNSGDFDAVALTFLNALGARFDSISANVGHVKFLLQSKTELLIGNLTGKRETATLRKLYQKSDRGALTVNARVEMNPQELEVIILEEVDRAFGKLSYTQTALRCLTPGRPNPTYRYANVV